LARRPARKVSTRKVRGRPRRKPGHSAGAQFVAAALEPQHVGIMRELFWQNVIREILTSLSSVAALRPSEPERRPPELVQTPQPETPPPDPEAEPGPRIVSGTGTEMQPEQERFQPELFDGRLAVILKNGERVPIADVFPVFACGINAPVNRPLMTAVECSVFQIRTPQGQVFTVPLHEIRGFHALTPELIQRISATSRRQRRRAEVPEEMPFGFAAFTSLSRDGPIVVPEAPMEPSE
jgi:hypothetical protein